jgi:putative ABC transport system substrate-binding protein
MIGRRKFFSLLGGAAAAWPVAAHAQQQPIPVMGFLSSTSAAPYKPFVEAIFDGLKAQGYVLGRNLAVEQRWAEGNYDRLPAYADDLVRMRVSVIVAIAPPAARAAKAATSSIPIVFSTSGNPVSLGLVSSLNRPGGNLTGVNFLLFEMVTKRLELLTKLDATADVIGVLVNPNNPSTARSIAGAQAAAQTLGKKLAVGNAGAAQDIGPAFARFIDQKARAISVEPDPFLLARREQIAAAAAQHELPAIYPHREYVDAGGLMSYGTNLPEAYRQIGVYAGRILKGEQPANLPVMQATKFELVINTKAAKALGIALPPGVLALADEVIE